MGKGTSIEWTDFTFQPWIGCSKVSPGCTNCYAEVNTFARIQRSKGLELWGQKAARHVFGEQHWRQPHRWNAAAAREGVRKRVFCASLADVFDDHPAAAEQRPRLWTTIDQTPWLDYLLLTKRIENVMRMVPAWWAGHWPRNAWIGTTVEDQQRADERIPHLLNVPAPVRFLSMEPLLGPVDLTEVRLPDTFAEAVRLPGARINCLTDQDDEHFYNDHRKVDWVIVGGESGPKARPFDIGWARRIVSDCKARGTAVFVKQLGRRPHVVMDGVGQVRLNYADAKGGDMTEWPEDLRIREFPA